MSHLIRDTHGNLSEKCGENHFYIKPSGVPYGLIGIYDVPKMLISPGGSTDDGRKQVSGKQPSVDTRHHAAIYDMNPHVGGVCHTHSTYCVVHATANYDVPCLTTEHADYFCHNIACLPYDGGGFDSWGSQVGEYIHVEGRERGAVLLERHGLVTWGKDCEEALTLAIAAETVAERAYLTHLRCPLVREMGEERGKWHWRYWNAYGQGSPDSE